MPKIISLFISYFGRPKHIFFSPYRSILFACLLCAFLALTSLLHCHLPQARSHMAPRNEALEAFTERCDIPVNPITRRRADRSERSCSLRPLNKEQHRTKL
ncbi:hypothetical protein ILYODFUR_023669 [Ilyodon furcidens]|uniref:Secreted protein n=1 Tax=Ilyodon furcidens TaxID=33524 RepID=A0ABV0TYZ1_9TELE